MQVIGIGWTGVLTENFASTLQFFSDVLELSLTYRDEAKQIAHFRFRSGQLFEIFGPSNRQRKEEYQFYNGPILGFEVENIEIARQEMITRGAKFITGLESWEDDMWTAFLGPQDHLYEIVRPARNPASRFGTVLGICSARAVVNDFSHAAEFFFRVMEMIPVQQDITRQVAYYGLPVGHGFNVIGSSSQPGDQTTPITIGFQVDDTARARGDLESRGLEFIGPAEVSEDGSCRSRFRAPDRYIYELICDPRHSP